MSLIDSVHSKCVGSAMAFSRTLAGITNETLTQVGTSLPQILKKTLSASRAAVEGIPLPKPITDMEVYALSQVDEVELLFAIKNAAVNADNHTDAAFSTKLIGFNHRLSDIQNGAGEALVAGISSFAESLDCIEPGLTDAALAISNSSLSATRNQFDSLIEKAYTAAIQSLHGQIIDIHNTLATVVQEQNALAEAAACSSDEKGISW